MDHSITAYLKRLSKEKAKLVLLEWADEKQRPDYVTEEMIEILQKKVSE